MPKKLPPSPLVRLPIIGAPFERVVMDLVGPLPKSTQGHKYILVIVDYATRYPKVVPPQKATSKNIAWEGVLLFSRVGLPSNLFTNQGMPFILKLMADVCHLL